MYESTSFCNDQAYEYVLHAQQTGRLLLAVSHPPSMIHAHRVVIDVIESKGNRKQQ
jgi:hypothetical protein